MSSTNLQNISYAKIDEPVVFAEMNSMLTRVGIKLERSAPPSRRGSPPRALTPCMGMGSSSRVSSPKSPGSFRKSYSSEIHQGGHVSSNFSVVSSARSMSEDILVSLEGDAHLRRLQQVTVTRTHGTDGSCSALIIRFKLKLKLHELLNFCFYLGLQAADAGKLIVLEARQLWERSSQLFWRQHHFDSPSLERQESHSTRQKRFYFEGAWQLKRARRRCKEGRGGAPFVSKQRQNTFKWFPLDKLVFIWFGLFYVLDIPGV